MMARSLRDEVHATLTVFEQDVNQEESLARYGEPSEVIVLKGFSSAPVPFEELRQKISML